MPVIATERKQSSDLIAAEGLYEIETKVNRYYVYDVVSGSGEIDNIGFPVVRNTANTAWVPYVAQDLANVPVDVATNTKVGVTVGSWEGFGNNYKDTDISVADTKMTVLVLGQVDIKESGIDWDDGSNAAAKTAYQTEMASQGVLFAPEATVVTSTYL